MFRPRGYTRRYSHSTLHFFMFAAWKNTNGTLNSSCAFLEFGGETRRRKFVSLTGSLSSGNSFPWGVLKPSKLRCLEASGDVQPLCGLKKAEMLRHLACEASMSSIHRRAKLVSFLQYRTRKADAAAPMKRERVASFTARNLFPIFSELARKSFALSHQGVCIMAIFQGLLAFAISSLCMADFTVTRPALHAEPVLESKSWWHIGGFCFGQVDGAPVAKLAVSMTWEGEGPLDEICSSISSSIWWSGGPMGSGKARLGDIHLRAKAGSGNWCRLVVQLCSWRRHPTKVYFCFFPSTSDNGLQPGIGIMQWLHAAMWNQLRWNWLWEQNMVRCPSLQPMKILMSAVVLWCLLVGGCMQEKTHFFGSYFLPRLLPVLASAWLWWCAADCGRERMPSCSQILELQNWTMWSLASHARHQREKSQTATSMPRRMPQKMQMFLKRSEGKSISWMVKIVLKELNAKTAFFPTISLEECEGSCT